MTTKTVSAQQKFRDKAIIRQKALMLLQLSERDIVDWREVDVIGLSLQTLALRNGAEDVTEEG